MREIKFRLCVGNKIVGYEKWYKGDRVEFKAKPLWLYSKGGEYWTPDYIYHVSKHQYTGLKDKNGKEIYEGDIIKNPSTYPLEIYWMGLAWGVRWKDSGNEEESIICDDGGDLSLQENALIFKEVIGNIYENPELIK